MGLLPQEEKRRLLYVLADGKVREEVPEGTPGAILREVKNDDGTIKVRKWEMLYPGISGFITGIIRYDGEYGTNINIAIKDENDEEFTLSLKASSRYGEDFLHKIPKIDFTKEITITTHNFTDKKNSERKVQGVKLMQNGEKLTNAYNWKDDNDKWQSVDGYPQVDEKKPPKNSDQWIIFFTTQREWVMEDLVARGLLLESVAEETSVASAEDDF